MMRRFFVLERGRRAVFPVRAKLLVLIMAVLATPATSQKTEPREAEPIQLSRAAIDGVHLLAPKGWKLRSGGNGAYIIADPSPAEQQSLSIVLFMTQSGLIRSMYPRFERTALSMLGSGTVLETAGQTEKPIGRWSSHRSKDGRRRMAIYLRSDPSANMDVMAMLVGPSRDFAAAGGERLITAVGQSVSDNPRKLTISSLLQSRGRGGPSGSGTYVLSGRNSTSVIKQGARASGSFTGKTATAQDVVGSWVLSSLNGRATSDFSSGTMIDMSGSSIAFRFASNRTYQMKWSFGVTTGLLMTDANVLERGVWSFVDGNLTLNPDNYRGSMIIMSGHEHDVSDTNPAPRRYAVLLAGNQIVLRGKCAPFQVELECENKAGSKETLDFPFSRD